MAILGVLAWTVAALAAQPSALFCGEYARDGRCATCYASYHDVEGQCRPPALSIPNCLLYSDPTLCAVCAYGFGLLYNHCVPLEYGDHCRLYGPEGRCLLCERGVMLTRGGCQPAEGCLALPGCSHCARGDALIGCLRCAPGYTVERDATRGTTRCVPSRGYLRGCWATLNGRLCAACDVNYYVAAGACIPSPAYRFEIDWAAQPA